MALDRCSRAGDLQRQADGIGGEPDLGSHKQDGAERFPRSELVDGVVTGRREDGQHRPVDLLPPEPVLRHCPIGEVPNRDGPVGMDGHTARWRPFGCRLPATSPGGRLLRQARGQRLLDRGLRDQPATPRRAESPSSIVSVAPCSAAR